MIHYISVIRINAWEAIVFESLHRCDNTYTVCEETIRLNVFSG